MTRTTMVHLELGNQQKKAQKVFVEPWGDELQIPPGAVWRFESDGTGFGVVAVELHPQGLAIYGLSRTNMWIKEGETTIWESFQPVDPPSA
jgi:hypothetical protein